MDLSARSGKWVVVLSWWICASCTGIGAAEDWHCLVGIGGAFASGYAGILARQGIPYEILMDHQLAEVDTLRRYDVVLISGLFSPNFETVSDACETYVQEGGRVVYEQGNPRPGGWKPYTSQSKSFLLQLHGTARFVRPSITSIRISGDQFAPELTAGTTLENLTVIKEIPTSLPGSQVWATYASIKEWRQGQGGRFQLPILKEGDAAIVTIRRGKGQYVVFGPALGQAVSLGGAQMDNLLLAMTRVLTDGRGVPQLTSESVSLGRKQTKRSLKLQAEDEEEFRVSAPPPPARTNGPGNRGAFPSGVEELSNDDDSEFNVIGFYSPAAGSAAILLNYWNDTNYWLVEFDRDAFRLLAVRAGRRSTVASGNLPKGVDRVPFVVAERAQSLAVCVRGAERIVQEVPSLWNGRVGVRGNFPTPVRYQPVVPVYFSDDFMRTEGETGEWKTPAGQWKLSPVQNPDMGANPFAFYAEAQPTALAETGRDYWDTYRFRVSVRPNSPSGQLGLMAYRQSDTDYLMFRARIIAAPASTENGFELVRVLDGKETVLGRASGALVQGQTYELAVKVLDKWVGGFVDGEKVLTAVDTSFAGGRIGLWVQNGKVKFDDVAVEPSNVREGIGKVFGRGLPSYAGAVDQDTWAGPAMQWKADPQMKGLFWNPGPFYGDVGLRLRAEALTTKGGRAALFINSQPGRSGAGYALAVSADNGRLSLELLRNGKTVTRTDRAYSEEGPPVVSLRRAGNVLFGRVNNRIALTFTDAQPLEDAGALAFRTEGVAPRIGDVAYWTANVLDYTFESAPGDWWVGNGIWDVTNRWSCTPDWSWFGGTCPRTAYGVYQGKAVIWNKRRTEGDVALDFYTGPKMLPVADGGRRTLELMQDFNASLCGDGRDPSSGYSFVIGPAGTNKAQILRNGKVVAENTKFLMPRMGHNRWINARAEKIGSKVALYFDGQLLLSYDDPQPLNGGYAAIWTENNGILIPRATLYFEKMSGQLLSLLQPATT